MAESDAHTDAHADTHAEDGQTDLTEGPVWKILAIIAGPMVFGLAAILSVDLVDTYFIAKLGTQELAALSFIFPVAVVASGLCIGVGAGAASVVSRSIGEGADDEARVQSLHSLLLGLLLMIVVSIVGALTVEPMFSALGASEDVMEHILAYMPIWWASMPFLVLSIVAHNIVRSVGNATWPSIIMTVASVLNIGATAALVFGWWIIPELGVAGAAAGTLVSRATLVWVSLWLITKHVDMVTWTIPSLKELIPSWLNIGKVAFPAALGNMVNPFSVALVTAILAGFSEAVVASFGVATRIETIAVIPLLAMSAALGPISGQNWGADKIERISKTLKLAFALSVAWAGVLAVVFWFFGQPIAAVFSSEESVAEKAAVYLRIVPLSLFGFGIVACAAAAFNAIDQATRGLVYYAGRSALLYLPLAWIGSVIAKAQGVYIGIAVANAVAGVVIGAYALWWLRRVGKATDRTSEKGERSVDGPAFAPAE